MHCTLHEKILIEKCIALWEVNVSAYGNFINIMEQHEEIDNNNNR